MRSVNLRRLLPAAALVAACASPSNPDSESNAPQGGPAPGNVEQPSTVGRFDAAAAKPLVYPVRLATAADGTVFVSDNGANQVVGFRDGHIVTALVGLDRPLGLALDGDLLYVGNAGRKDVEVYSLSEAKFLRTLGGAFSLPNDIAVAPDGEVYVADSRADQIKVFGADGQPQSDIGTSGEADGQLRFPSGVAVDATRVVVADQGNHRVQIFDRDGEHVRSFGSELQNARATEDFRDHFTSIGGVALRGEEILVVESAHAFVQVFDENGESKGMFGRAGQCGTCTKMPLDVVVDAAGRVFASDPEQRRFVTLNTEMR